MNKRMIVLLVCLLAIAASMIACGGGGDCQDANGQPVQCMASTDNEKTYNDEIQGFVQQTQEEFQAQVEELSSGDISQNYNCQSVFEDCQ